MCTLDDVACFAVVNASGLAFERALQATVAQGLANRAFGAAVYVVGYDRYAGMAGIEWFAGEGDYGDEPGRPCANCAGLRARWLATIMAAQPARRAVRLSVDELLEQVVVGGLVTGGALFRSDEAHALGPVLTACGVYSLLPATSLARLPRGLAARFDGRGRWADATAAALYVGRSLLPLTNRSTLALQAPTNLPFLADAIVAWRLPVLWMDDMCREPSQRAALRYVVEGSGHFDGAPVVQYVGWFNNTHRPNRELVCQCTARRRLVTIASDWAENLSFLSRLPPVHALAQPADAVVEPAYDGGRTYVALIMSDGDNLAQDWTNLRPNLERRIGLRSKVPVSWTLSNRWATFGGPVLRWFYQAAASSGGYDSFLMGPSGYGYVFPGAIADSGARREFASRTAAAAASLGMEAYVHWDEDFGLDARARARAVAAIRLYNGTAVRGAFALATNPLPDVVGDVTVVNRPALPWGFTNASEAAAVLNALPRGTLSYAYQNMKADPASVDALAALLQPHVRLLGHRELLRLARLKREAARLRAAS